MTAYRVLFYIAVLAIAAVFLPPPDLSRASVASAVVLQAR